jgi:hypothetical protein
VCSRRSDDVVVASADLPDGSYFKIHALPTSFPEPLVTLERGYTGGRTTQGLSLDPSAGLVRVFDRGEDDALGIRTGRAEWLAELGRRTLALECAARR